MKKLLHVCLFIFISTYVVIAQQIATESFNYIDLLEYEIDGEADGGEGWDGPWEVFEGDAAGFTIEEAGEIPDGIEISTTGYRLRGECLTQGTGLRAYRPLATPIVDDGSNIWISFIIESEYSTGESWQGVSLWSPDGESEQTLFGKNWGPLTYGVVFKGVGVDSDIPVEDNIPVWLVVKIELSGDDSEEQCYLWVNPDPTVELYTDDANATVSGLLNNGATHIACHFGNTEGIVVNFDELMLANTFEEVIPNNGVGINTKHISSKISNCYPNPFKNSTTIDYNVNNTAFVSLDIYNIAGEKIESLINGKQNTGNYSVEWNATNQTSGVYFYKLKVGDIIDTKKVILE